MLKFHLLFFLLIGCNIQLASLDSYAADNSLHLTVESGKQARKQSVLSCEVPAGIAKNKYFSLIRDRDGKSIPVQIESTQKSKRISWILDEELPPHTTRKYKLQVIEKPINKPVEKVVLKNDGKKIHVLIDQHPVLVYNHATVESPLPNQPYYARSGYIHPLYTPSGEVISDDFNPDHAHQHGIMFAWRKMLFDGREMNTWDQKENLGRIEHVNLQSLKSGPVFGELIVQLDHVDLSNKDNPVVMLKETWKIRVFALTDHFLFDIISRQKCATEKSVLLKKHHYGGMAFRGHAHWHDKENYDFLTSDGLTKINGNHTRPNWVNIHGPLKTEHSGVTIFDNPENLHFPQPVRLHPKMPYFCFVPIHLKEFRINPGKSLVSKYRFHVHTGKPNVTAINRLWEDYTNPAQVKITIE